MIKKLKMEDVLEEKKPQPPRQRRSVGCYVFDDYEDDLYIGLTSEDVNPNEGDK